MVQKKTGKFRATFAHKEISKLNYLFCLLPCVPHIFKCDTKQKLLEEKERKKEQKQKSNMTCYILPCRADIPDYDNCCILFWWQNISIFCLLGEVSCKSRVVFILSSQELLHYIEFFLKIFVNTKILK